MSSADLDGLGVAYKTTLETVVAAAERGRNILSEIEDKVPPSLRTKVLELGLIMDDLYILRGLLLTMRMQEEKEEK